MITPHNNAKAGDYAKTVLMPGDPLRAKFIAEVFLEDAHIVNDVRNMYAYTGTYKGVPISVMASGNGNPASHSSTWTECSTIQCPTMPKHGRSQWRNTTYP